MTKITASKSNPSGAKIHFHPTLWKGEKTATLGFFINDLVDEIFLHPRFDEKLQKKIEDYIIESWIQEKAKDILSLKEDNPFDAIYLADLQPDKLHGEFIEKINSYSHITDLSDTISFKDQWDD